SFIAGADVNAFESLTTVKEVEDQIRPVVAALDRLERAPVPVIAAIHGFCLGGGLEIALACHYRIVVDDEATRLGVPEVKLGLFPGFNGTVRMIGLAGPVAGMEAMLTGRMLKPRQARAMGLADQLVPGVPELRWAARKAVLHRRRSRSGPTWLQRLMCNWPVRGLLAAQMRKATAAKAREEHYPAPFKLIELFARHGGNPGRMAVEETKAFAPLMVGDTSRNLRRIFRLSEMMKAEAAGEKFAPVRAHVVGAGTMGGDIAAVCVLAGMEVSLQDQTSDQVERARRRCEKLFRKRLREPLAVEAAMTRLIADVEGRHVRRADMVIEAVFENLKVKQDVLTALEPKLKPGALLATNTSSLPLEEIAEALHDPARLIGLHFFNPVPLMPLVEIVRGRDSREADIRRGCSAVVKLGKFPLIVRSSPGFLVNRVLAPYLLAAMTAYEQGVPPEKIDAAAEHFGMVMGPAEVADNVGLDVCHHVAQVLGHGDEQGPKGTALITAGKLGKKTGEGIYRWRNGKPVKNKMRFQAAELERLGQELIAPLLAECEKCVTEGIVASADHADAGIVFGAGFAPFRGGPMHFSRADKAAAAARGAPPPVPAR
ncbi:MAG: 3-hydroxyacyl-CoA dehydrogenase NAD-binding domain-containing protein, partial [Alphaproteobacteria bacterium]|nr:3-hydroxyacyl-CoA dehydrogenase NAD-binding domain-containing protein [Alphaproteobacteria bacterium]